MTKRFLFAAGALATGVLLVLAQPPPAGGDRPDVRPLVSYPDGYQAWRYLGSVVGTPNPKNRATAPHGMIHHLYANELALEGLRTGNFADGAVFVADWFALKQKYQGGFDEGARNRVDVMVRDARFADTGGWSFDQFAGDSRTVRNVAPGAAATQCFSCHSKASEGSFVFTRLRP